MLLIGLMSGTSLDGIDAALVRLQGDAAAPEWGVESFLNVPYSVTQRERIHEGISTGTAATLCRLNADLGEWFAGAALALSAQAGVDPGQIAAIGSHGQTIWHEPPVGGERGATLQLGCAATLAERTGIPVVSDFRARDMAAGGEGAPLVPWVDRLLFSLAGRRRVLQNIGGMGNLTWLPAREESTVPLVAFDTGPGNALVDAAVELATGGRESFDRDGRRALRGTVDETLLAELMAHPFFHREPPRSTGREVFGHSYVEAVAARRPPTTESAWNNLVATLTALTARSIGDALRRWVLPRGAEELVVTGGGARNPAMMSMIRAELPELPVRGDEVLGLDGDAKEAVAFAVLAWAYLLGVPANAPEATGARGPRILGSYTPAAATSPTGIRR